MPSDQPQPIGEIILDQTEDARTRVECRFANETLWLSQPDCSAGFTMDDQRLKSPPVPGSGVPDYCDELLERIRDIRASEGMCLRVRDIFKLAVDYDPSSERTQHFFQTIQNKPHFAATCLTAPELHRRPSRSRQAQPVPG